MAVAEIFVGGVGGFGGAEYSGGDCEEEGDDEEFEGLADSWVFCLGAKKREITCCFCFPMAGVFAGSGECREKYN